MARRGGAALKPVSDDGGLPYGYEILPLDKLFVDDSYQRPLTSFVERIKSNFDPALVGILAVSARSRGKFAIVDGQTRWAAMTDLGMSVVPCLVYYGLSQQDEASLFSRLQRERRGIASFHRFRAAMVAGDPEAVDINRIANECGYEVGLGGQNSGAISAVAGLEKVYRRGPDRLERVLTILREAWKDKYIPNGEILRGLGYLLDQHPDYDDERMALRLSIVTPEELKRRASALREGSGHGGGSDRYMAGAIEGAYLSRPKKVA